jgi:hypothetical protein
MAPACHVMRHGDPSEPPGTRDRDAGRAHVAVPRRVRGAVAGVEAGATEVLAVAHVAWGITAGAPPKVMTHPRSMEAGHYHSGAAGR